MSRVLPSLRAHLAFLRLGLRDLVVSFFINIYPREQRHHCLHEGQLFQDSERRFSTVYPTGALGSFWFPMTPIIQDPEILKAQGLGPLCTPDSQFWAVRERTEGRF